MRIRNLCLVLVASLSVLGGAVIAEEAPLVDGSVWTVSTEEEKEAYLVGAGNFMTVEYIVQSKAETAPSDEQSAVSAWWGALEDTTINDLVGAVDSFYGNNPDKMDVPVLVVIWNTFVETD